MPVDNRADVILNRIYEENPSFWPYGLTKDHFDGGLYLVKDSSNKAVGFVGWQERKKGRRKVGYYSVGILPEHRKQGFAKAALDKLLAEKSASVDEVQALIKKDNIASQALAARLHGVNVVKLAAAAQQLPVNPLNTWLNKGVDWIVNPLERMGGNFSAVGRHYSRGRPLAAAKSMGSAALNAGNFGLNLMYAGAGANVAARSAGWLGKGAIGAGRNLSRFQFPTRGIGSGVRVAGKDIIGGALKDWDLINWINRSRGGRGLVSGINSGIKQLPWWAVKPTQIAAYTAPQLALETWAQKAGTPAMVRRMQNYKPSIIQQADVIGRQYF